MDTNTIYYLFDPHSPGWLKRRLKKAEHVSQADVARVARSSPECLADPLIREHAVCLLEGKVVRPKGRKPQTLGRRALIWVAGERVREQIAAWRAGIGEDVPLKVRGEPGLAAAAYSKFGRPLGLSGPALANAVSSLKSDPLFND